MKKSLFCLVLVFAAFFASCEKDTDFKLSDTAFLDLDDKFSTPDSTWVGDESGEEKKGTYFNQFTDGFFVFNNYYTPEHKSWSGFAMTNGTDTKTGDYTNNSAITGGGKYGNIYLTAHDYKGGAAVFSFADEKAHKMIGMYVTNSTYAYHVILKGNQFANVFADGDWFKLDIYGKVDDNMYTDTVSVYLADYRNGKTKILKDWKYVSLKHWTKKVKSVHFNLSSTDVGQYGMNTPAYFCLSGISALKK